MQTDQKYLVIKMADVDAAVESGAVAPGQFLVFKDVLSALSKLRPPVPLSSVDAVALVNSFAQACAFGDEKNRIKFGDELVAALTVPAPELDVRKILLGIVPGDGNGLEVYAKSVEDVERKLTEMGQRIEDLESAAPTQRPWIELCRQALAALRSKGGGSDDAKRQMAAEESLSRALTSGEIVYCEDPGGKGGEQRVIGRWGCWPESPHAQGVKK